MAAGDIEVYSTCGNKTEIDTLLTGKNITVNDKIVAAVRGQEIIFVVVKAA